MLRPSPNHGTQRLPNDNDDGYVISIYFYSSVIDDIGVTAVDVV